MLTEKVGNNGVDGGSDDSTCEADKNSDERTVFIMNRMPSLYCFIEKRCIASAGILGSGTKEVTNRVSTGVVQQMAIAT